jgi:hypothetical protein
LTREHMQELAALLQRHLESELTEGQEDQEGTGE